MLHFFVTPFWLVCVHIFSFVLHSIVVVLIPKLSFFKNFLLLFCYFSCVLYIILR